MVLNRKELELAIAGGTANELDFDGFEPADVFEIKQALPLVQRFASSVKAHDAEAKTVEMIFNVQVVDRMGDLILSNPKDAEKYGGKGWDLEHWELAGSPYLHVHNHNFVVGKVLSTRIQRVPVPVEDAKSGKAYALIGLVQFLDHSSLAFSQADYLLATEGIGSSSVGFMPKMMVWIEDEKERQKLGLGNWGAVLPWNSMLEISFAPVPANQVSNLLTAAGAGDVEKSVDAALARFVNEGKLTKSLADDFRRLRPLGPTDAAERTASRLRGFLDVAQLRGWQAPEGVTLACTGGVCRSVPVASNEGADEAVVPLAEPIEIKSDCGCSGSAELTALRAYKAVVEGKVSASGLNDDAEKNSIEALAREVECLKLRVADLTQAVTRSIEPGNPSSGGASDSGKLRSTDPEAGGESSTGASPAAGHELTFDRSAVAGITSRLRTS